MGQQQLILLVLATIIVGLAIVVGIRAFNENSVKSNSDAMMQDLVRMANDAQAWKQKPAPFGGQGEPESSDLDNFSGLTLAELGYPAVGGTYTNLNGDYTLVGATGTGLDLQASNTKFNNTNRIFVCGVTDTTIVGAVVTLGGAAVGTPPTATDCP